MRIYQVAWWTSAGLAVLVGVSVAAATRSSALLSFTLFLTLATCAAILSGNLHLLAEKPAPPRRILVRRVTAHALATGSAAVACYGLGTALGGGMIVVLTLLGVSSPPVANWVTAWARPETVEEPDGEAPRQDPSLVHSAAELSAWSDAELYSVWCSSVVEVAQTADRAVVAAQAREYLLAELERRHPDDAAAWLQSGAGLEGEPPTFLIDEGHHP